ncbi:hypothetical protein SRS16CHR_02017 [Variovorax sp. SRS16]|uniref:hypothetical protein n=1 Tax=Variovorax sp. SRS16 TaxID=282217 RepID=UPI001317957A|nr:hypothetical protein [Variovorax sp. SRS16]VTU17393.1 hypothetical protein SRS16CHR_02017 [Variovorax sp. SRS16]
MHAGNDATGSTVISAAAYQAGVRDALGAMVDTARSAAELDRFRTRLERSAEGTEIYVSHRGMREAYGDSREDRRHGSRWTPIPNAKPRCCAG